MPVGPVHLYINQSPLDSQTGGFAIREGSTVFFVEAMICNQCPETLNWFAVKELNVGFGLLKGVRLELHRAVTE